MASRRKSPFAVHENISPNKNAPRSKMIRRLTPHCVAGNLTMESTLALSAFKAGGGASTSYAIGSDGRCGLGVEETNRPWTTSSGANDHEAITFEIANDGGSPDWHMSDKAINAFLDQAVETCRFYGFKKVNYQPKPANVARGEAPTEAWIKTWAKSDEMIITLHTWYANKACPGAYFIRQIPWLVNEMNKRLQNSNWKPEAFIGEGGTKPSPETKTPYLIRITTSALNVRTGPGTDYKVVTTLINDKNIYTITEEKAGQGATKWGRMKSGIGWISLDYTSKV